MTNKVLSLEEVAALTKIEGARRVGRNSGRLNEVVLAPSRSGETRNGPTPQCNHDFVVAKTIISGTGKEWPTKRCSICTVWLLLGPDEVPVAEVTDMGDWLA